MLSATGYVEWILGDLHARTQMHVVTSTEPEHPDGAVLARNAYNAEFGGRVAFFDAEIGEAGWQGEDARRSVSGDRVEFIGRYEIGRAHVELQSLMRISYAVLCFK